MRKNKLFLLLALLLTAATGAWATNYTTLAVGDVIKVGDTFSPTADGAFNENGVDFGKTYTLMRADIDNDYNVTEKTDGAYYVFKHVSDFSPYMHFGKAFAVTAISDGLVVTKIEDIKGMQNYTLAVHEPAAPAGYTVSLKDGVKDAGKWTVKVGEGQAQALPIGGLTGLKEGDQVTIQYNGRLKVKGVKATSDEKPAAPAGKTVDLSTLTGDYEAQNGDVLTGTLNGSTQPYKITIADGATVTLDGAVIKGNNDASCQWAGLNCLGDATIVLKDGTTNTVRGFYEDYPGILVPKDKTLTIQGGTEGTGKLTASSFDGGTENSYGAGIGGGLQIACGDISIEGGVITAKGSQYAAGIGGGYADCGNISITGGTVTAMGGPQGAGIGGGPGICGNISITGGTVTATGGQYAAGIGSGNYHTCGNITIANTVTKVTATKGEEAPHSIGKGDGGNATCGTVTIGGTVYWQNNAAVGEGATYLATSPLVYPAPAPATASTLAESTVGMIVGTDGKAYAAADKDNLPTGVTAVAMVAYKSATTGSSLAIALADEGSRVFSAAKSTCAGKTAIGGKSWKLPSENDWKAMFKANGDNEGQYTGLNTAITNAGGTALASTIYWSSTDNGGEGDWAATPILGGGGGVSWDVTDSDESHQVRAVLAF